MRESKNAMSSAKPTIYLDLDRTLFATAGASELLWAELARHYALEPMTEIERQRQFYVIDQTGNYYYDFAAHLQDCGIDPDEAATLLTASPLADGRLLMAGAAQLIERLRMAGYSLEILTFGDVYYQRLKAALCPVLRDIPINSTLQPKAMFLADKGDCVLVDDKNIASELPANVRFYWVQLEAGTSVTRGAYTSLERVADELLGTR